MNPSPFTERYGNLLKQEELRTLEDQILPNTFVLEAPEPFPGFYEYYSDHPVESKPLYVYFVVKQLYTLEQVTRATQNIRRYFQSEFDAAAGVVNIYQGYDGRIRHLRITVDSNFRPVTWTRVSSFARNRWPSRGPALIRIKKFLSWMNARCLLRRREKDHGYFTIPKYLNWKYFEDITKKVKYNWEGSDFDAAIGHFHVNFGIQDMIRIYNLICRLIS